MPLVERLNDNSAPIRRDQPPQPTGFDG
jgi:hypothetical protein